MVKISATHHVTKANVTKHNPLMMFERTSTGFVKIPVKTFLTKIGKEKGLSGRDLSDFIKYVTTRNFFHDDYYVREWAGRFSSNREWAFSDGAGRSLLREINPDKYGFDHHIIHEERR